MELPKDVRIRAFQNGYAIGTVYSDPLGQTHGLYGNGDDVKVFNKLSDLLDYLKTYYVLHEETKKCPPGM